MTVQGPVKEQQPDGMSHRGGGPTHSPPGPTQFPPEKGALGGRLAPEEGVTPPSSPFEGMPVTSARHHFCPAPHCPPTALQPPARRLKPLSNRQ